MPSRMQIHGCPGASILVPFCSWANRKHTAAFNLIGGLFSLWWILIKTQFQVKFEHCQMAQCGTDEECSCRSVFLVAWLSHLQAFRACSLLQKHWIGKTLQQGTNKVVMLTQEPVCLSVFCGKNEGEKQKGGESLFAVFINSNLKPSGTMGRSVVA